MGWSSTITTRMGVFGKIVPQAPEGQRNPDFDLRAFADRGGDLHVPRICAARLLDVLQSPNVRISHSLLQERSQPRRRSRFRAPWLDVDASSRCQTIDDQTGGPLRLELRTLTERPVFRRFCQCSIICQPVVTNRGAHAHLSAT